jgi:multidrug efflux pump subunit AcrA (membrane-fusion protein)
MAVPAYIILCGMLDGSNNTMTIDSHSWETKKPHATHELARRGLALGLALLCGSLLACSSGDAKQPNAHAAAPLPVSVAVVQAKKSDVPVYLVGLGSATAFYTANIKSRVDGQIMRVNFQEGQVVKEGDLLIVIDPRPYQVQLEQMQAQLFKDQAT